MKTINNRSYERRSRTTKGRFQLGVLLLAVGKILRFFFNLIGQSIFTDFYARGHKRKLLLFFLPASFFLLVFPSVEDELKWRSTLKHRDLQSVYHGVHNSFGFTYLLFSRCSIFTWNVQLMNLFLSLHWFRFLNMFEKNWEINIKLIWIWEMQFLIG